MMELRIDNLGHRFTEELPWLFRELNLTASRGERCALTGPSGSGKSTLLSIVAGWLMASEGKVHRDGISRMHWVFENPHGVTRRSAIDHVAFPILASGSSTREADLEAQQLCNLVGLEHLEDRRSFSMLSGGEAQRLMLARALACKPDLLLVDEPTAQLDRRSATAVNAAIASIGVRGGIVLVATHDPGTAEACDRQVNLAEFSMSGGGQG